MAPPELAEFFEFGDESPDGAIGVVDGAVVDGGLIVEGAIRGDNLVGSRDDRMGLIEPEVEEEGSVVVAFFIEPGNGFVNDDLAGVAFYLSHAFTIAQKLGWVLVAGARAVDEAKPIGEAMIGRGGILAILDGHA